MRQSPKTCLLQKKRTSLLRNVPLLFDLLKHMHFVKIDHIGYGVLFILGTERNEYVFLAVVAYRVGHHTVKGFSDKSRLSGNYSDPAVNVAVLDGRKGVAGALDALTVAGGGRGGVAVGSQYLAAELAFHCVFHQQSHIGNGRDL